MRRTFIFCIKELDYQKGDLSIPHSNKRATIGTLSRMITNAIFLSHKLRQRVTIRIFVLKPNPHLYEIKSESIRYLGPDLRSSASLLLKGENFLIEKQNLSEINKQIVWYEPNPGLFLTITDDPFIDLNIRKDSMIFYFSKLKENKVSKEHKVSLVDFEMQLEQHKPLIFLFDHRINIINDQLISEYFQDYTIKKISLINPISFPSIITLINLILDDTKINDT
ncbi:MAG: hypothetical protein FK730_01180 [Asgard group archaeon]|nr:hypothetical protein [Asgard group archaeon]